MKNQSSVTEARAIIEATNFQQFFTSKKAEAVEADNILKMLLSEAAEIKRFKESLKNPAPISTGTKIFQKDLSGNIIAEFESVGDAVKATSVDKSHIYKVINGVRKTAGGFIWSR